MKRLILVLTLSLSFISFSSFAKEIDVNTSVLESFNSTFKNATEVSWTTVDSYYKANFAFNGQYISAFYDAEGHMVAISRNITTGQLPLGLQFALKKDYSNLWISDLFEISGDEGTYYCITLETGDTKIILKSIGSSTWTVFKKASK
ncbi:MAG TPA: hypothetical protein VNR87_10245 [Flavisolibacter sp.]|nr:hypothetical protein [Flavisolibacter sp.]